MTDAPGEPGTPLRWLASGKSGAGAAFGPPGRVWFTIADGILTETAFPRIDQACLRDFGLVVTDGGTLFAEEKRDCDSVLQSIAPGVPGYDLVNTHRGADGRFRIRKRIIADPVRAAVLQYVRLEPLGASLDPEAPPLLLHALVAPHLVNDSGYGTAWIGDYKGVRMLFAEGQGAALAVAVSGGWHRASAGFVGASDGWHDLQRHRRMEWSYERAVNGNVALTGQVAPGPAGEPQEAVFALGFGRLWTEAALRARSALEDGFDVVERGFVQPWRQWQNGLLPLGHARETPVAAPAEPCEAAAGYDLYRNSMAMLRIHGCQPFPGAVIGSLAVPWGAAVSDGLHTGNHLVRPRDVCACAAARLAAGDVDGILDALGYLEAVQEADGSWPLTFWLDGMAAWRGIGLEDVAQPILLADLALHHGALDAAQQARFWPMLRATALFLMRQSPESGLNRWNEEDGSPVPRLAAQAAALAAASAWAERHREAALAAVLAETADLLAWAVAESLAEAAADPDLLLASRAGILPAADPRLVRAAAAIDAQLLVTLPGGAAWRRRADQAPHAALIAERALYALQLEAEGHPPATGTATDSTALLGSLEAVAGPGGLLPEQVDEARGAGGAVMPHLWTHALHVILLRSRRDGAVFDRAAAAAARYGGGIPVPSIQRWTPEREAPPVLAAGMALRLELPGRSVLRWSDDGWTTLQRAEPVLDLPEMTVAVLPPARPGQRISLAWGPQDGAQRTAELAVASS